MVRRAPAVIIQLLCGLGCPEGGWAGACVPVREQVVLNAGWGLQLSSLFRLNSVTL